MPVISLFYGSYCNGDEVARKLVEMLRYNLVDDREIVGEASKRFKVEESKLLRAMAGKTSVFNKFTHERERSLAFLRAALADRMRADDFLLFGLIGHMIPRGISHVLKVLTIADMKHRATVLSKKENLDEKEAARRIHREDESFVLWVEYLFKSKDPWSPELYDIVLPMDKNSVESAAMVVCDNIRSDVLRVNDASRQAVEDFILAAEVGLKLALAGHDVGVEAECGTVTLSINKHVMRLSALEQELKALAGKVSGVTGVETRVGSGYYQSDVYRKFDFELPVPSKVLLVDDEREFVQTLSERLQMRDMASAVVYDGEEALSLVAEDEPEVMVLDLKMPGIDGLEVLRRVKREHPNVEVIVLTGHGSKEIEQECLGLGACAYLEKPVDIDTLTRTMKSAYRKLKDKKSRESGGA